MSLFEYINNLDGWVVKAVNQLHTPALDSFMWEISTFHLWLPMFLSVALLVFMSYRRRTFYILLAFVCIILCANIVGDHILKPLIGRLRPTHCDLVSQLQLVAKPNGKLYYGGLYSHPSGHASTSFAFVLTSLYYLRPTLRRYSCFLAMGIFYVLIVSFSRIYLCVHYPTDILNGYLLGGLIVTSWILLLRKWDAPLLDAYRMEDIARTYNHSPLVVTDC